MKIKIRYDNQTMTLDVPEEDFTVMVQMDYEDRCAKADDPASVQRRTPQEIMDERFNRPDYNNWQTFHRHWDPEAVPPVADNAGRRVVAEPDDDGKRHHFTMDEFPDLAAPEAQKTQERDQELRTWIRKKLKPDYAEMLIAIHMEGVSVTEYAAMNGEKRTAVSNRLQRAEKKFEEIFPKRVV